MKVLVIGGTGTVGSQVVHELLARKIVRQGASRTSLWRRQESGSFNELRRPGIDRLKLVSNLSLKKQAE